MVSKSIVAASAIPAGKISRTAERAEGENIDSPVVRRIGAMEFDGNTLIAGYLTRSVDNGVGVLRENTSIGLTLFDQTSRMKQIRPRPSLGEFRSNALMPIRDHVDN